MRAIFVATFLLLLAFIIKTDIQEGSLQLASFYQTKDCSPTYEWQTVVVKIQPKDTILGLFATTPSPVEISTSERLAKFYEVNPHLVKQTLVIGELIQLPMYAKTSDLCSK